MGRSDAGARSRPGAVAPPADALRLTWLRVASQKVARGHRLEPDELLSEMVIALGGQLERVTGPAFATRLARWRLADWKRSLSYRSASRGRGLRQLVGAPLSECKERWAAEQPAATPPPALIQIPGLDALCLRDQLIVQRISAGATAAEVARELGMKVNPTIPTNSTVLKHYQRALRRLEGARVAARRRAAGIK